MVAVVGSFGSITSIAPRSFVFLILSGAATGASWICYFKALSLGDVNKVVPVDKSSVILTVLFAVIVLGETNNLAAKLIGTVLIATGTFLMIEKKAESGVATTAKQNRRWLIYAALSAIFAALTSILAKIGIDGVESNLGTAVRTCVVLIMAWGIVLFRGKGAQAKTIDRRELLFIILSGIATGASWLSYYYAIQNGVVSVVVPIDKLSVIVSIVFSFFVFGERLSKKALLGLILMIAGTLVMAVFA